MCDVSEGGLLNGRLIYRQLVSGHRSGFEPVLLAATIPIRPGELVLEAGTGAGAALLCLASRQPNCFGVGLEIEPRLVRLANENFKINKFLSIHAMQADAAIPPFTAAFDHIISNPPWHDSAGTASPDQKRALAHRAPPGLLTSWIAALVQCLKPRGTVTFILPAASYTEAAAAFAAQRCGGITLFPLWPRAGQPARQVIITAQRGSGAPAKILAGLVLHDADGISPPAQTVLRDGCGLDLHL